MVERDPAYLKMVDSGAVEKAAITTLQLNGVKATGSDVVTDGLVHRMEVFPENP